MHIDAACNEHLPVFRPADGYRSPHPLGVAERRALRKNAGTRAGHPHLPFARGITDQTDRLGYCRKVLLGNRLQIVASEKPVLNSRCSKVRYFARFGISCQFRRGENKRSRHRHAGCHHDVSGRRKHDRLKSLTDEGIQQRFKDLEADTALRREWEEQRANVAQEMDAVPADARIPVDDARRAQRSAERAFDESDAAHRFEE